MCRQKLIGGLARVRSEVDEDRTAYHPRRGNDSRLPRVFALGPWSQKSGLEMPIADQSRKNEYSAIRFTCIFTYIFVAATLCLKGAKNAPIVQSPFAYHANGVKCRRRLWGGLISHPSKIEKVSLRTRLSPTRYSAPPFPPCSLRRLCTNFSALLLQRLSRAYPLPCEFAPVSSLLPPISLFLYFTHPRPSVSSLQWLLLLRCPNNLPPRSAPDFHSAPKFAY
jgi:hypothetical protein